MSNCWATRSSIFFKEPSGVKKMIGTWKSLLTKSSMKQKETVRQKRISFAQIRDLLTPTYRQHRIRLAAGFAALLCVDFLQLTIPRIIKYGIDGLETLSITVPTLFQLGGLRWYDLYDGNKPPGFSGIEAAQVGAVARGAVAGRCGLAGEEDASV